MKITSYRLAKRIKKPRKCKINFEGLAILTIFGLYTLLVWHQLHDLEDFNTATEEKRGMKLIRDDPVEGVPEFPQLDENDWFDEDNVDNMEGDQRVLDNFIDEDALFGVVKPLINEEDQFLGRNAHKKPRLKFFANDQEFIVENDQENCLEKHQKIKGKYPFMSTLQNRFFDVFQPFTERLKQTQKTSLNCPLLNTQTEEECLTLKRDYSNYFSDSNVLKRLDYGPEEYFHHINTVAYQKVSNDEENLHIAFTIVTHGNLGILEAQLASLFKPHNAYCIYIDKKAASDFVEKAQKLIDIYKFKFPSSVLFIAPDPIPIFWSDFSLLQADLECMEHLLKAHQTWKYFVNQAGSAMPTVALSQLASILTILKGKDSIRSRPFPSKYLERIKYVYSRPHFKPENFENGVKEMSIDQLHMYSLTPKKTFKKKGPPPFGLSIFKGLKESVISRKSVEFFLYSEIAMAFRKWCLDILFPEEIFFQTLCRIDQEIYLKTAQIQQDTSPTVDMNRGLCIRRTLWEDTVKKCHGKMKRYICNLSMGDLPEALQKKCLFLNKFGLDVDGSVITCLHQHLTNDSSVLYTI